MVNTAIAPWIARADFHDQTALDAFLNKLDGTSTKERLGANAILATSIAFARASAMEKKVPLWKHLRSLSRVTTPHIPRLFVNVINGGLHAGNGLHFQEYLIIPKAKRYAEAIDVAVAVYHELGRALLASKGRGAANLGDEGGYAPIFKDDTEPFALIRTAAGRARLGGKIDLGMDAAATDTGFSKVLLKKAYERLIKTYKPIYLEDPFSENDFSGFSELTARHGKKMWIAGDDLTTTNVRRMAEAHEEGSVNSLIIKPNQIGSVTEALDAVRLARKYRWGVIASHRSGETNDDFIADFAYGVGADGFKLGAPARGERVAKYNRLLEIERER